MDSSKLWTISSWCAEAALSRGWYYIAPPELKPRSVRIGRAIRIVETPKEYGERILREQAEKIAA